MGSNTVLVWCF